MSNATTAANTAATNTTVGKVYLANGFSVNMLTVRTRTERVNIAICPISPKDVKSTLGEEFTNAIGHQDLVSLTSDITGVSQANRCSAALEQGDKIVLVQYVGPRLPEGATSLPEGSKIEYYLVTVG